MIDDIVIHKLLDIIIDDKRDADWSDNAIIEELINCGLTKEDFVKYGFERFVEDYFEDDEYAEDLPREFDFKSNINTFGLVYHAVEEASYYVVTHDNCRWIYSKPDMHNHLSSGKFVIIAREEPHK